MKKWMYVISVSTMLAIFLALYYAEANKIDLREKEAAAQAAAAKLADDAHKADIEAKARADAEKRSAERMAEEAKKEADKVAKWEAEGKKIQDATDKYNAEADASAKQAADIEVQLGALRATREKLNREAFDLAKLVEHAKIDRRTAEMEIQRTVEMISRRAADSSLTRAPMMPQPTQPSS